MTRLDPAEIIVLYRRCYAGPPWSETPEQLDAYPDRLARAMERPSYSAWAERDHEGRLIGICYGWPTPADLSGSRIYDLLTSAFGAPAVSRMTAGSFEVVELFVHPRARGKGIASALLAQAVAGWPKAWLITSPEAPAARLYHRLGWREAGPLPADPPLALFTRGGAENIISAPPSC